MRITIHSGIDQLAGFDVCSDHCRANVLATWTEIADNSKMNINRILLSMALLEQYWNKGRFDMQEGYIQYVCNNKAHPELWCPHVTMPQAKTIRKICSGIRWRYQLKGQNIHGMNPEELSTFRKNETLVKILFPEEFVGVGKLNQEAVSYRPLTFPVARGKATIEHHTDVMSDKLFKRIEDFWTQAKVGPMRDPGEKMD